MCTSVKLKKETKARLAKFGTLSGTYDTTINDILDHLDKCDQYWNETK